MAPRVDEGVDHGVADDANARVGDVFAQQVPARAFGGREVQGGETGHQPAVRLLGKGIAAVPGAQSGFDVGHRDAQVEGAEGAHGNRRRVALDDDGAWAVPREEGLDAGEEPRREIAQGLARLHQAQVLHGRDPEVREDRLEELHVLSGEEHGGRDAGFPEGANHGRKLDRLGARANEDRHRPMRGGCHLRLPRAPAGGTGTALPGDAGRAGSRADAPAS